MCYSFYFIVLLYGTIEQVARVSLNLNIGIGTQIDIILSRPYKKEKLKSELLC
nr:MAG TPA: hypothetical protein [Caudoviricetes sp.]